MVGLMEPTTLTGWINLAIKVDKHIHECLIDSKGKHNNNNNFNQNTYRWNTNNWITNPTISEHSHSSPTQSTPRPSSIATTNYTSPKGPLMQEEKNCHRTLNLCMYCGDAIHLLNNCPHLKNKNMISSISATMTSIPLQGNDLAQSQ